MAKAEQNKLDCLFQKKMAVPYDMVMAGYVIFGKINLSYK